MGSLNKYFCCLVFHLFFPFVNLNSVSPSKEKQAISSVVKKMQQLIARDKYFKTFFDVDETPVSFLTKAKRVAELTSFVDIREELKDDLIPELENLVQQKPRNIDVSHQVVMGRDGYATRSLILDEEISAAKLSEEIARLNGEIAKMRQREKERLDAELADFSRQLEQGRQAAALYTAMVNEIKERIVIFKRDLERIGSDSATLCVDLATHAQIDSLRLFFAQQIINLERCLADMSDLVDQLKVTCDALAWLLKKQSGDLEEAQEKNKEAWMLSRKIMRLVDALQQLGQQIKDTVLLAVQTKFDLERYGEENPQLRYAAGSSTRKRRR